LSPFEYSIEILDMQGRTVDVIDNRYGESELTVSINDLFDGTYLIRISSPGSVRYSRFVKNAHN
ncbi:MAG TPA: T9SS type A sorting domain-containing protein, partial [Bacteroidia bacterium]|nr:T9SS type A sorting domain-containing protein [Bacteroidia bacterium]